MDQGQRQPIKYLKSEVKILKRGMIDTPCLEQCSEDTNSVFTPVLELLDERMKHHDINTSTGGGGVGVGMTDTEAFKENGKGKL